MRGRVVGGVLLALLIAAALGALGTGLYQAGVDAGLASTGSEIVVQQPRVLPGVYPYYGFGVFGIVFRALFVLVFVGLIARLFLFGRWARPGGHWKGGSHWSAEHREDFRHRMEDHLSTWHERAHAADTSADETPGPAAD